MTKQIQFPVSDEQLKAIGHITVAFSFLESTIAFFIWELLGSDQRTGQITTAGLPFNQLANLFASLYKHRITAAERITKLEALLKKIGQAQVERNTIIHSQWAAGEPGTVNSFKMTAKKSEGFQVNWKTRDVSDLERIATFIAEVGAEVQAFMLSTFL